MAKNYEQYAEKTSVFFTVAEADDGKVLRKGERENTAPMGRARFIAIERIKPDPDQPRKTFKPETLNSLAESIRELGEIIDPITVEFDEPGDFFRIISGERRYRAARLLGLETLPCIIKEVDEKKRALLQLIANLQREDMTPLEESDGIRSLAGKFGYSQATMAKLLNRSESYISQILGLQRLSGPAREILQTSEVSKEVQIRASREKDPAKQEEILRKVSEQGKTVRQIRAEEMGSEKVKGDSLSNKAGAAATPGAVKGKERGFKNWSWHPEDKRFEISIRFSRKHPQNEKPLIIRAALKEALQNLKKPAHAEKSGGERNLCGIHDQQI